MALSQKLQEKIDELSENYKNFKHHLESMVEKERNAECYRIDKNILLLINDVTGGIQLFYGNAYTIEQATSYLAKIQPKCSLLSQTREYKVSKQ